MQDSQGQILALAFRQTSLKARKLFPLRSEAVVTVVFERQRVIVSAGLSPDQRWQFVCANMPRLRETHQVVSAGL